MTTNYELYKVFYWAAKTGSLTQAAKALYITQPSVSHAIKQLEESFGLTLFYRNSKGVALTQEGVSLYSYIEQSQILISLAEEKMAALKSLDNGELRIGGSDSLFKHYMLAYLEEFHVLYPNIKLHLSHGTTPEVITFLKEGKIDLGVVRMPIVDPQLEVRESIQLKDCFVAGERYAQLKDKVMTLEMLLEHQLILFSRNSRVRMAITELFNSYGYTLKPEIEVGSVDLLIEFARRGLGISYVTREFISKELEEGSLFEIQLDVPLPPSHVGIMTKRNMPISLAANRFMDLIFKCD
ncbi:LysR family transcriptional regulator [Paenibacillus sp. UMB7766-LJ446]|jgi:DNA-binding transcriptional LysR family regulator|uniref:LysR family transcriptional regulator n=1 Tax=Paenibacillus TaxID=44249 RepID=UPI000415D417|nr:MULTISPECIES: LysR family transcriptional regulator [Paenibacillus]KGP82501.1 LysR family transcriptional regulator [Paenibacillus sp. MAEPY2]KGP89207.1 LysR family transcriptional regulator [Paenibacillus sp. MAEPY1]MDK8194118.1 LysR family transcriptional regulator [Paenibacillus sp. UMB7766-LJ446]MDN8587628.1 LysR family transcriptional regulator [Paenibacillus sp. 11B]OZQ72294.1 LysR family transcriptional regulator [Paenibacillus taichungensis]